jgi:hypothetical protein
MMKSLTVLLLLVLAVECLAMPGSARACPS